MFVLKSQVRKEACFIVERETYSLKNKNLFRWTILAGYTSDCHLLMYLSFYSLFCAQGVRLSPGVIYVGHLPQGLFESQIKTYFEQFGKVLRLRLSRSKKVKISPQTSMFPWLRLKMSSDVTLVWGQIPEPKVYWCIKLITCSPVGSMIKPMFLQNCLKLPHGHWSPKLLFKGRLKLKKLCCQLSLDE